MTSSADPQTSAPAHPGVRVAVDAIGGDHGAPEVVPGALAYARAHPEDELILCGDEALMAPFLLDRPANVRTVHAPELIGMDEHPARALVRKKRSSIVVAARATEIAPTPTSASDRTVSTPLASRVHTPRRW